jgi:hypothetical protein
VWGGDAAIVLSDFIDLPNFKLPPVDPLDINGKIFLSNQKVDGIVHHKKVMHCFETIDGYLE